MSAGEGSEAAWDALHEALPARWRVGPVIYYPAVVRPRRFRT